MNFEITWHLCCEKWEIPAPLARKNEAVESIRLTLSAFLPRPFAFAFEGEAESREALHPAKPDLRAAAENEKRFAKAGAQAGGSSCIVLLPCCA